MKINNSRLSSLDPTETSGTQPAGFAAPASALAASPLGSSDDIHLSELVRSLRSLVADPERQARIEYIARSYASGTYQVDPQVTASRIIDDAFQHS
jgi:anti-sigma28 factor (negative regulator of flagellin synthesis)